MWLKAKRGLGGEWELGRLVVPAEVATRWQPGSSLSPPQPVPASLCASLWAPPAVSTHTAARRCGHEGIHSLEFTIPGTDLLTVNE